MIERFWAKVKKTPTCWLWKADTRAAGGYGRFFLNGKDERAHRVAWELARGPIPAGLCVLHRCDVRSCVRPDHLFLGTKADNVSDMFAKGRQPSRAGALNGRSKARRAIRSQDALPR